VRLEADKTIVADSGRDERSILGDLGAYRLGFMAQPTGTECGLIVLSRIDSGFSQNGLSGCYTLKGKKFPRVGL